LPVWNGVLVIEPGRRFLFASACRHRSAAGRSRPTLGKTRSAVIAVTVTVLGSEDGCGSSEGFVDGVEFGPDDVDVSPLHFDVVSLSVDLALLFLDKTSLLFKFLAETLLFHLSSPRKALMRERSPQNDRAHDSGTKKYCSRAADSVHF
jgi:hypothetical protein